MSYVDEVIELVVKKTRLNRVSSGSERSTGISANRSE